jgi:hypothetical protein
MALTRNHKVSIAVEVAYGDGGTGHADIPVFYTEAIPTVEMDRLENVLYSGSIGRTKFYAGRTTYSLPLKFYLKGSGTAGTAAEVSQVFEGAGLDITDGASTVTYVPMEASHPSVGILVNLDGIQYWLKGARAEDLKITFEAGKKAICEANFKGLFVAPTAVAFAAPTFANASILPPTTQSMALTINSKTHVISKFVLDLKNVLVPKDNINAANYGIASLEIVGREFGGNFIVEVDADNDLEYWTALMASTEVAIASTGIGAAGNLISIATSTMQIEDVKPVDVNGIRCYDVAYRINAHATPASELVITFA